MFTSQPGEKTFNLTIHHFRGIVIMMICLIHILLPRYLSAHSSNIFGIWIVSLFGSSSAIFAFISGYLAYMLEFRKIQNAPFWPYYMRFIRRKITNVYMPMLILSCLFVFLHKTFGMALATWGPLHTTWYGLAKDILFGSVNIQFWYIPFIMTCFVFVPFLLKMPDKPFLYILVVTSVVPFFFPRGDMHFSIERVGFSNFLYLLAYHGPQVILGMAFARYESSFLAFIKNNLYTLIVLSVLSILFVAYVFYKPDSELMTQFISRQLFYIKNITLILLIYYALLRVKNTIYFLDVLARYSFCIYFLHVFIRQNLYPVVLKGIDCVGGLRTNFAKFSVSAGVFVLTVLICIAIGRMLQRYCGKYSRMICGV